MPKQIKVKPMEKAEKTNCFLSIILMFVSMGFSGALIAFMNKLSGDSSPGKWLTVLVFGVYCLFIVMCLVHCIQGLYVFKKHEYYGTLFMSALSGAGAFTALINAQFAAAMLAAAVKSNEAAKKIIGGRSFDEFMPTQRTPWTMLVAGISLAFVTGIIAILKLAKKQR